MNSKRGQMCVVIADFSSGHNLAGREFKPYVRLTAVGTEPASDPLPLSLCPSSTYTFSEIKKRLKKSGLLELRISIALPCLETTRQHENPMNSERRSHYIPTPVHSQSQRPRTLRKHKFAPNGGL